MCDQKIKELQQYRQHKSLQ